MMDQGFVDLPTLPYLGVAGQTGRHRGTQLTIALINNMPDAALSATERQFCSLLAAASAGSIVNLKFYSSPEIPRSHAARLHIAKYYDDFSDLEQTIPDGVIVTGAEPSAIRLEDEPVFRSLSRIVEWVDTCSIPSIWSCLAAHVALYQMDGIERQRLERKLSGVFECHAASRPCQIMHGVPQKWNVPQSRFNGLREADLIACGYTILSRSRAVGANIFMRQEQSLHLFFQGHPEYEATTLLREYRRDVSRFLGGERSEYPAIPTGYLGAAEASRLHTFALRAKQSPGPALLPEFNSLIAGIAPGENWSAAARRLYLNWITYLGVKRTYASLAVGNGLGKDASGFSRISELSA